MALMSFHRKLLSENIKVSYKVFLENKEQKVRNSAIWVLNEKKKKEKNDELIFKTQKYKYFPSLYGS